MSHRCCRGFNAACLPSGKEPGIGRDTSSPIAAIGVLSLGFILPIGAGPFTDKAITALTGSVEGPAKTITLIHDGHAEALQTRAATVEDLLLEEHIARSAQDALDVDPASAISEGETIHYRAALAITLVVDGTPQIIRSSAATVGALLAQQNIVYDRHDQIAPDPDAPLTGDRTVEVAHVSSWVERGRTAIAPHVHHVPSFSLALGATKVVDRGLPGIRETSYLVVRNADRSAPPIRSFLASRVIRQPRVRVIAAGIGEYTALADFAVRGFDGTVNLARAALSMVATAYTSNCIGCSGITASGHPAGHGIVAVDPRFIPLGTHLFIPGYGHAVAGDTGGAIRGNRIDLGFNSDSDANRFGRRAIVVYVLPER